jgi:hypothetical protein
MMHSNEHLIEIASQQKPYYFLKSCETSSTSSNLDRKLFLGKLQFSAEFVTCKAAQGGALQFWACNNLESTAPGCFTVHKACGENPSACQGSVQKCVDPDSPILEFQALKHNDIKEASLCYKCFMHEWNWRHPNHHRWPNTKPGIIWVLSSLGW